MIVRSDTIKMRIILYLLYCNKYDYVFLTVIIIIIMFPLKYPDQKGHLLIR